MRIYKVFWALAIPGLVAGIVSLIWRPSQAASNQIGSRDEIIHLLLSFWGIFGVFFLILSILARPKEKDSGSNSKSP